MNKEVTTNLGMLSQKQGKATLMEVERAFLVRNPEQDRTDFNEKTIAEIASSMKQRIDQGLLPNAEPLWVEASDTGEYQIISGETRDRAAESIGYEGRMSCLVYQGLTNQERSDLMALANNGRNDLNLWEKARAVCRRIEDGQNRQHVMDLYGLSKSVLSRLEKFYNEAPEDVKQLARDRIKNDINTLLELSGLPDNLRQEAIAGLRDGSLKANNIKDLKSSPDDGLSSDKEPRTRKPTKISIKSEEIRLIISESPSLRKAIKAHIPGNGFKSAHGGDLVEAFNAVLSDLMNNQEEFNDDNEDEQD
jgi:ParB/RepB/Spo0J family partition protein